ncbi:DUF4064 domain-containing protein [Microbacterium sp. NPDC090007]|uniref:DUF4064 domain-containing protein n=1 Tax=Microbacterium sp. NPDC090007 TaxID=3364204 RepID=UPI00380ABF89
MSTAPPPPEPYGQPDRSDASPAPAGQSAYGAPAPQYAAASRPVVSKKLGVIAFVASLIAVVLGAILAVVAGLQSAGLAQYADGTGQIDPENIPPGAAQAAAAFAGLSLAAFVVYGLFGLWGFIQGIVAAVKNRGRGWGIAAIIVAVLGGIVVVSALGIGASIGIGSTL